MLMAWVSLIFAGLFECVGVMGLDQMVTARDLKAFVMLFGGFVLSFLLLNVAMQTLPMGVAYAVWTGIGAGGATLAGMVFFGESKNWKRLLFISMIIVSVIGLKLLS